MGLRRTLMAVAQPGDVSDEFINNDPFRGGDTLDQMRLQIPAQ